ncbi:MAG: hypothetical protein AAGE89_00425 [Pseudomonadota bacterium]
MLRAPARVLSLILVSFFIATDAQAWDCDHVESFYVKNGEDTLSKTELLRKQTRKFAEVIAGASRQEGQFVVVGRFSKNSSAPFLHEEQLEDIRSKFWPPSKDVEMPQRIEYTYGRAYSFQGYRFIDGKFVPFSVDAINARVSISSNYQGIVDVLPETEIDVLGILRSRVDWKVHELTTSYCPTYLKLSPDMLDDLISCYDEGACK